MLPTLRDSLVTLRPLKAADAPSLLSHVYTPLVLAYISPPPNSIEGFKRFIRWTHVQRRRGSHLCFGIVAAGDVRPAGLAQLWAVEPDFSTAECGFVMGETVWGRGLFEASAGLLLDFAFDTLGVRRLEMRTADANERGNRALAKLGAVREGTLRCGFRSGDILLDHAMWSILADEWYERRLVPAFGGGRL